MQRIPCQIAVTVALALSFCAHTLPGATTFSAPGMTLLLDRHTTGQALAVPLLFQLPVAADQADITFARGATATDVSVTIAPGAPAAWQVAPLPIWAPGSPMLATSEASRRWTVPVAPAPSRRWLLAVDLLGTSAGSSLRSGSVRLLPDTADGEPLAAARIEVLPQAGAVQALFDPPVELLPARAYQIELDLPHPSSWYPGEKAPWAEPCIALASDAPLELRWTVTADGVEWTSTAAALPQTAFPLALLLDRPGTRTSNDPWLMAVETAAGRHLPAAALAGRARHPAWQFEQAEPWLLFRLQPALGALLMAPFERTILVGSATQRGGVVAFLPGTGRLAVTQPSALLEVPLDAPVLQSTSVPFNATLQAFYRQTAFAWLTDGAPLDAAVSARVHAWDGSQFHRQLRDLASALPTDSPESTLDAIFALGETALWSRDTAWFEPLLPHLMAAAEGSRPAPEPASRISHIMSWLRARKRLAEAEELLGRGAARDALGQDAAYGALMTYLRTARWNRERGVLLTVTGEDPPNLATLRAAAEGWLEMGQLAWVLTRLDQRPELRLGGLWPLHDDPAPAGAPEPAASVQALAWEIEARLANGQYTRAWDLFTQALKRFEQSDRLVGAGPLADGLTIAGFVPGKFECWDPALRSGLLPALYVTGFFGIRPEPAGLRIAPRFPPNLQLTMVSRIWYGGRPLAVTRHANLAIVQCIGCQRKTGGLLAADGLLLTAEELERWHGDPARHGFRFPDSWRPLPAPESETSEPPPLLPAMP